MDPGVQAKLDSDPHAVRKEMLRLRKLVLGSHEGGDWRHGVSSLGSQDPVPLRFPTPSLLGGFVSTVYRATQS
jgi:hypothetical protein